MSKIRIIGEATEKTVRRLYLASADYRHIIFFFPTLTVKDIRIIVLPLKNRSAIPGRRGRPIVTYDKPSVSDRIKILKLYYEGYDVVEIAETLKSDSSFTADINAICYFLAEDENTYFGIGRCIHCKQYYIYLGDDSLTCSLCNLKNNKFDKNKLADRLMTIPSKPVNCVGRISTSPRTFGYTYHPLMRYRLIENSLDLHELEEAKSMCKRIADVTIAMSKKDSSSPEFKSFVRKYMPAIDVMQQTVCMITQETNIIPQPSKFRTKQSCVASDGYIAISRIS